MSATNDTPEVLEGNSESRRIAFTENASGGGVEFQSRTWGSYNDVLLECRGCGAMFRWPSDKEDDHLPNRRFLNHCPGCGKIITGCVVMKRSV
jgi:hypothetical protein